MSTKPSLLSIEIREGQKGIQRTTGITLAVAIISAVAAIAGAVIAVIFAK